LSLWYLQKSGQVLCPLICLSNAVTTSSIRYWWDPHPAIQTFSKILSFLVLFQPADISDGPAEPKMQQEKKKRNFHVKG